MSITKGRKYQICSQVGRPLIIGCGPNEYIYIHKTILSDWPWAPGTDCELPLCSQYCHVYADRAAPTFNGREVAQYTFLNEPLSQYPESYGECNASSTANFVHIVYECLQADDSNSICNTRASKGDTEGFITSPSYPNSNSKSMTSCQCELSATNGGTVTMSSVFVNPTVDRNIPSWRLQAEDDVGDIWKVGNEPNVDSPLSMSISTKVTLTYTDTGDQSGNNKQLFYVSYPPGFWIKYSAFPTYSKINIKCYEIKVSTSLTGASIAIICCSVLLVTVFVSTFVFLGRKWYLKRRQKKTSGDSTIDVVAKDDQSVTETCTDEYDWHPTVRYNSLPELYHSQNFREIRLVEMDPKRHKEEKRPRKSSTSHTSATSSMDISVIKLESRESRDCSDSTADEDKYSTFASFDIKMFYIEGVPESDVDV